MQIYLGTKTYGKLEEMRLYQKPFKIKNMNPFIHTSKTPEALADAFAKQLIQWVNESNENSFHLALSGGKTPSLLFTLLAEKYASQLNWSKIHFWWGDERMVPPADPESNFGVVNKLLFSKIGILPVQIHRVKGESDPIVKIKEYSTEIQKFIPTINGWPTFDLIMLGMGDDGHTASIFPNQMQLMKSDKITAIAVHPESGQKRITLTGEVLNHAKRVAFLVSGTSKSRIFNEIITGSDNASAYPASHIHPIGELHWFVDEECAGK